MIASSLVNGYPFTSQASYLTILNTLLIDVIRQDLWRAMSLMPILGLTWILIFIRFANVAAIDYIFTALIGLQGFFFFIFHCLLDRQVSISMSL